MAGYSGTPLVKKLGMKAGMCVMFINEPNGFSHAYDWPDVKPANIKSPLDFVLLFAKNKSGLQGFFDHMAARLSPNGIAWVAWPKKSSGLQTDLDENGVRKYGLRSGLVDVKVCAIDETWSGLKFVIRVKDRPRRTPKAR